jgi:hypothetical protein
VLILGADRREEDFVRAVDLAARDLVVAVPAMARLATRARKRRSSE